MSGAGSLELDGDAVRPDGTAQDRATRLVEAHFDFVWRLLRRLGLPPADADDAAQQVFMIATSKLSAIESGRERTFLYGTALRIAANARRGVERRREAPEAALDTRPTSELGPERSSELADARALLDELLSRLPEELRRVLILAEIEQLAVPEIAELEQLPVGTAASRLRRARSIFREQLAAVEHRNPFGKGGR